MKYFTIPAAVALAYAASSLMAHEFSIRDLVIDHPMAFETAKMAKSGGGFMNITNNGLEADKLLAVEADFPKVEIHTTEEKDGVAKMIHIESLEIPAGETVTLKPGGYHVMFMGLNGDPLEVGEEIPATLVFEKAGKVEVIFNVEKRGEGHGAHSN